jgi:phospholipid/cholesterol/gamma-HCH transport system substrate-binding protein
MNADLTKRSRRLFGLLGAGTLGALAVLSYLGVRTSHPGATYLTATFDQSAQGLDDQSDVKIRGINVGGVSSVKLTKDGHVTVRIRQNHGVKAPTTTTAVIQPLSIFGPKFIDLQPGSEEDTGPYLANGAAVPHTQGLQDLTDIATPTYNLLGAVTPQDLATLLTTFSQGIDGRGQALAQTLDNAAKLLDLSTRDTAQLRTLIQNGARISDILGSRGNEIVRLARDLNTIDPTLAGDPVAFKAILSQTSALSDNITTVLNSHPQGPGAIISSILPAVRSSYDTMAKTPTFLKGVGAFFAQTSGILQVPGPQPGTLLGTETVHEYLNDPICTFILGLCSPYPQPLPYPKTGGGR